MTVQAMRPAVDDPLRWDLGAEVPPGQAFGLVGFERLGTLSRADQDRWVFHAAIEKGAVWVVVGPRCRRRRGTDGQFGQCAEATRCLDLAGIGHSPTALRCGLTQAQSSAGRDHPQLVPTPFQHGRANLNPAVAQLQARTLGGDGERGSTLDRQDGLRPSVEQPGLDPNQRSCRDRAWRAAWRA